MRILVIYQFYRGFVEEIEKRIDSFDIVKINSVLEELSIKDPRFYSEIVEDPYKDVIPVLFNSEKLQKLFEAENSIVLPPSIEYLLNKVEPTTSADFYSKKDHYIILAKQIFYFRPQIVIVTSYLINHIFLFGLKEILKFKLLGYINPAAMSPGVLSKFKDYKVFDFVYSPFLPAVIKARGFKVPAELIPLYFIPKPTITELEREKKRYDIVFSGSFHYVHRGRLYLIEEIAKAFPKNFYIFTQTEQALPANLRKFYKGSVFGADNLKVLAQSKIVVNNHGDILPWAHNLRLYETTGVGTFLLTDNLPGLSDLFEIGKECEAYYDSEQCIKLIAKYLEDDKKREEIARAGQEKTLKFHTAKQRAKLFAESLKKYGIIK